MYAANGMDAPTRQNLARRLWGTLVSPRTVYQEVAAAPRWLGVAAAVVGITIACHVSFQSTEVGRTVRFERTMSRIESAGVHLDDATYERFRRQALTPSMARTALESAVLFVGAGAGWIVLGGVLFLVFSLATAGQVAFRQVFAVVVTSSVVQALRGLVTTPWNYQMSAEVRTDLGVLLPFLDESSFLARTWAGLDLFTVWWLLNLAVGISVLYRKKVTLTGPLLLGGYLVIALATAAWQLARSG